MTDLDLKDKDIWEFISKKMLNWFSFVINCLFVGFSLQSGIFTLNPISFCLMPLLLLMITKSFGGLKISKYFHYEKKAKLVLLFLFIFFGIGLGFLKIYTILTCVGLVLIFLIEFFKS